MPIDIWNIRLSNLIDKVSHLLDEEKADPDTGSYACFVIALNTLQDHGATVEEVMELVRELYKGIQEEEGKC